MSFNTYILVHSGSVFCFFVRKLLMKVLIGENWNSQSIIQHGWMYHSNAVTEFKTDKKEEFIYQSCTDWIHISYGLGKEAFWEGWGHSSNFGECVHIINKKIVVFLCKITSTSFVLLALLIIGDIMIKILEKICHYMYYLEILSVTFSRYFNWFFLLVMFVSVIFVRAN